MTYHELPPKAELTFSWGLTASCVWSTQRCTSQIPPTRKDLLPSLQGVWLSDSLQLTASESASATENNLTQGHVLPRADLFQPPSKVRDRETILAWDSSEGQLLQNVPTCWPTFWQICISLTFPSAQSRFLLILSQVSTPNKHLPP